ncbi:MAG: hypothetical protein IKN43_12780, partial [Selenomonadaceae bacterium]|nr:hypothetical protein [Selenomonadaceae bacterium]
KFSYKSNNRNVYKNGNKLLEFPYGVDAITPINVAKNEYLILSGSVPYVYKNGSFTQVQWNGKNFYPLNKRVRYMSQLQNLKNAYTK